MIVLPARNNEISYNSHYVKLKGFSRRFSIEGVNFPKTPMTE